MLSFDLVVTAAQCLSALIIAGLLLYYYRVFHRDSLRQWAGSFAAMAVYLFSAWLALRWSVHARSGLAPQLAASSVSQIAGYLQLALAVVGTYSALHARPISWFRIRWVLLGAAVFGIVCALAWAGQADAVFQRLFMRVGLRYIIGSICFVFIAVALWQHLPRDGIGTRIAASAMGIYGLQMLHVFAIYVWQMQTGQDLAWSRYVGIIDLVATLFIGFGLMVWLLEEERNRGQRSDSVLRRLRDFDPVTGFPNRRRLLHDLPQWLRQSNQHTALLLLRLDQEHTLSGTLGIVTLETVMAEVASRFEQHTQAGWHRPARLSESRLVQAIPRVRNTAELTTVANDLLASMRVPFYTGGQELSLSASIGIALSPEDSDTAESLIAAAEVASQQAHDNGGNRFQFFSSELNTVALTRLGMQSELRRAMLQGEMELYYQPLVAGDNHHMCGVEVLVRWNHPQRGTLLPEMFIAEMGQLGLIEELDRMVLQQACSEACQWKDRFGCEINVSVNISTRSFQHARFPDVVRAILEQSDLQPSRLELEIVESGALDNPDRAIHTLTRLRALGVRLTLDDFGTGYSSLAHLRELPVDCLKIDRSFVDNVISNARDAAIVAATITLAHSLGLDVVVEGVETEEQLDWFREHNADRIQGFLFSAPVTCAELHRMLKNRDRWLSHAPA